MAKKTTLALCFAASVALIGCSSDSNGPDINDVSVDPDFVEPTDISADQSPEETPEVAPEQQPEILADAPELGDPNICTVDGINAWVDAQMRDYYIFADQVPVVNLSDYSDPADLVRDLRVDPDEFSSISELASRNNLFQEGETFGFGFAWRRDQQGALRFADIVSGSPMFAAGLERGDRVLALNGIPELDLTDNSLDEIFGDPDVPITVTFTIERGDDEPRDVAVTSSVYTINTVSGFGTFTQPDGTIIGFLESSIFLRTSEEELDTAIGFLAEQNVDELILDFRYNGGGFVFIAQKLAAQLVGSNFTGRTFQSVSFNSRYEQFNSTSQLEAQELNLDLSRIVMLTTSRTASASEAIANNLSPYVDVVLIGDTTRGKPFASVSNPNCDLALNAMDRITSNDVGGTVLGGLTPTCQVTDEFLHARNSRADALTGAAWTYIETGTCPAIEALGANQELRASIVHAPIDSYTDFDSSPMGMLER